MPRVWRNLFKPLSQDRLLNLPIPCPLTFYVWDMWPSSQWTQSKAGRTTKNRVRLFNIWHLYPRLSLFCRFSSLHGWDAWDTIIGLSPSFKVRHFQLKLPATYLQCTPPPPSPLKLTKATQNKFLLENKSLGCTIQFAIPFNKYSEIEMKRGCPASYWIKWMVSTLWFSLFYARAREKWKHDSSNFSED